MGADMPGAILPGGSGTGEHFVSVSVVIPAFRAAATLRRTVESCLATLSPSQVVIVLDGPDAEMEHVARSFPAVQVVVLPVNQGAPVCRNAGLNLVRTRYVIFLDADDYVEDGLLEAMAAAGDADHADLIFGPFAFEMPDGRRERHLPLQRFRDLSAGTVMKRWLGGHYIPPCAVLWRSDYVRALGGWDETLAKNQDGDIIHRALMNGARIAAAADGLGVYVQDDNPGRITRRHSARTLQSQLCVLDKIRVRLGDLAFDPSRDLALAYYALARLAYSNAEEAIGATAEGHARRLGFDGQHGSFGHVVMANVLGLRGKQRLARFVKSLAQG